MIDFASIADTAAKHVRWVAMANGILLAIGISVSLYVYMHFPHLHVVHDPSNRPSSETIESYLFKGPAIQAFLFLVPMYQAICWSRTVRGAMLREKWLRRNAPYLRSYYSKTLNMVVSIIFVCVSAILLSMTIYHSVRVAEGSF
jgi:hypothetical protein